MNKDNFFYFITICTAVVSSSYSIILPFFPLEAEKFHFSLTMIGVVFSAYSIGMIFSGIIVGAYISKIKQKSNVILINFLILAVSTAVFGLIGLSKNRIFFGIFSVLMRTIHGFSNGIIFTMMLSFTRSLYPEDYDKKIALIESGAGFGNILGILIGSALIAITNIAGLFCIWGTIILIFGILYYLLEKKANLIELKNLKEEEQQKYEDISYKTLCKNRKVLMTYILTATCMTAFTIVFSKLSISLKERFHLNASLIGLIISLSTASFTMATTTLYSVRIPLNHKLKFFIGLIFLLLFLFLTIPHTLLNLTDRVYFVIFGCSIMGFGLALIFVPLIPEFTKIITEMKIENVNNYQIDAMTSGLYISIDGVGQLAGPLLGFIIIFK